MLSTGAKSECQNSPGFQKSLSRVPVKPRDMTAVFSVNSQKNTIKFRMSYSEHDDRTPISSGIQEN